MHQLRIGLVTAVICCIVALSNGPAESAKGGMPITPLAVHAHRYQDFQRNAVACEVFGEIKNTGGQPVKSLTLHLEMLDAKGRGVANEDLTLPLRVIVPGNAKGESRAVRPNEIGNFIQDTKNCPEQWLEGRIKYSIRSVQKE
jgi:hypothetical protein